MTASEKSGTEPGAPIPTQSSESDDPRSVPLQALTSERKKRQSLESELEALRKQVQERAEAEATERGEFRNLWETRGKPSEERVSELEAKLADYEAKRQARQEERKLALGEFAADIPEGITGDALDGMLSWAEKLQRKTATSTPASPTIPSGTGSQDGAAPASIVSEKEAAWMRMTKPSWLNAPVERQRSLLDKFGPSWARTKSG